MRKYFMEKLLFIMVSAIWRSDFYFLDTEPSDSREPLLWFVCFTMTPAIAFCRLNSFRQVTNCARHSHTVIQYNGFKIQQTSLLYSELYNLY